MTQNRWKNVLFLKITIKSDFPQKMQFCWWGVSGFGGICLSIIRSKNFFTKNSSLCGWLWKMTKFGLSQFLVWFWIGSWSEQSGISIIFSFSTILSLLFFLRLGIFWDFSPLVFGLSSSIFVDLLGLLSKV